MKKRERAHLSTRELIARYTQQEAELPESLSRRIENQSGETLVGYAFVDLNERFQLAASWVVLTSTYVFVAKEAIGQKSQLSENQQPFENIQVFDKIDVHKVIEKSSLSCNRLIVENPDGEVLFTLVYSHRQSRSVAIIKFLLEQTVWSGVHSSATEVYQKSLLKPVKEAQSSVTGSRRDVVWRLLGFLKPYRKNVYIGLTAAILMTLVSLIPAYLTGYMIDHVVKPYQSGSITLEQAQQIVFYVLVGMVVTYVLRELFAWIRLRTMAIMGEYVARDLRNQVYKHLHTLSLGFFSSKQTGSLISRVGSDTDRIWDFVAFGVVEVSTSVIMLVGLSIVLIGLDVPLGLLVTLPVPLFLWAIYRHGQRMQKLFLRAWRKWSDLTDCLSDAIPGIRVVKAFHQEEYEKERFVQRNQKVSNEFTRIHKAWTGFWPFLMMSIKLVIIGVWVFGLPRVLDNITAYRLGTTPIGLTPGAFVSFILYLGMFVHPIEIIGQMARMINRATSSAHRVFEVLDTEPQIVEVEEPKQLESVRGEISFQNVTFSYDGVRKVIKDLSFHVQPGQMVGLVGSSGSGKTTIINLISRFYDVSSGRIMIDGEKLKNLDLGFYRKNLGIVLQDPYLFHGTVLENIRYACPEASLDEVIQAAKAANAHDFICQLSHGYDTIVGERGQALSGGERQRVSIARAILRNPRILILDEATSAVDSETERKIQEALDRLVRGRTTIAIAHRLSTLRQADRLLVIDKGVLVEEGTHTELMAHADGKYKKMVDMQQHLHENLISQST